MCRRSKYHSLLRWRSECLDESFLCVSFGKQDVQLAILSSFTDQKERLTRLELISCYRCSVRVFCLAGNLSIMRWQGLLFKQYESVS